MGKIRTKIIGLEDVEKKQAEEAKARRLQKAEKTAKTVKGDIEKKTPAVESVEGEKSSEKESGKKELKSTKKKKAEEKKAKKRGVRYQKALKLIDQQKLYSVDKAVELLKKVHFATFDETVELHLNLNETGVKGEVAMPHSTGKQLKIAVVDETVLEQIAKGKIDFDILVTHPSFMPKLVPFAKILGPRGLMPNPKSGTVSDKPEEVAKKLQSGATHYKSEAKFPILHQSVGKLSYPEKSLVENIRAFLESVDQKYIKEAYLTATMTPSVKIDWSNA